MRTIAIGDIHGCRASLEALVEYAGISEEDTLVTLGDYVDRGPDSKGVIDFLLRLRERSNVVNLMGNHEILMMEARDSLKAMERWMGGGVGGRETLQSYGGKDLGSVPEAHWEFIEGALPFHETDTHFFVHANAASNVALEDQDPFMLFWEKFRRVPPHRNGKVMVCGHTAQKGGDPANLGHAICIDTWAFGGQWLTALDAGSGNYWQCNEEGMRRTSHISAHLAG
jgi:serine/threonine protein phosphatase 1